MIDFCEIVNTPFEQSPFYRKSLLMLILFYLHVKGKKLCDLEFLFSVLWKLDGKDLLIIRHDYEVIINKIKEGKAHELSEGDTMYLGACRKGQKGDPLRKQPYSEIRYYSPISHVAVPKKAYWFNQEYVKRIIEHAYDEGESSKIN